MRTEYLLFNVFVGLGSFLAVYIFRRHSKFPQLVPAVYAVLISACLFIVIDQLVTNVWWYFNRRFTLGLFVGSLPVEEMMFFFSVPFACLQLWVNIKRFITKKMSDSSAQLLTIVIWLILFLSFTATYSLPYTRFVILALACIPIVDFILKTKLLRSWIFILFIGVMTNLLTFFFNGYLTARPIVTYNQLMKTHAQVFSIPIEDFAYGMVLIALVIILYEFFAKLHTSQVHSRKI